MIETQLQIKKVSIGKNITILCKTIGEGKPMVFIHGWGYPWAITEEFVSPLKKNFKLYFMNLPGYDGSDISKLHGEISEYADVIFCFLEKLHIENSAVLIGHSLGCIVILKFLKNHPQNSNTTILFGLPIGEKLPIWANILLPLKFHRSLLRSKVFSKKIADFVAQETQKIGGNEALIHEYHGSVKPSILGYNIISGISSNPEKIYTSLEHKPMLVYGERERFKKFCTVHDIPYQEIKDCGHSPMLEKPEEAAKIILNTVEGK